MNIGAVVQEYAHLQWYHCVDPDIRCQCRMQTSQFVSKKRRCSGCLISLYCSEKCQRAAWRSGHRKWCQVLRCTVGESPSPCHAVLIESPLGPCGLRDIRNNLQI